MNELSESEERKLEENLVWIFASPRSGTTWLKNLLSYETASLDEFNIATHLGFETGSASKRVKLLDFRREMPDYIFSLRYKDSWNYYLRKLILNRIYFQFKEISKKVIIKEPALSGFSTVSECLPNSKIIILLRDGRDVLDSQTDARTYGFEKGGRFEKRTTASPLKKNVRPEFIKNQSLRWVRLTKELLETYENHAEDKRYKIKYETLLNNTLSEMEKIYNFLEIKIQSKDLGNIVEKLKFENNGFLLEKDPKLVSKKIIILLKNEEFRKKISKNSRKTITENFAGDVFIDKLISEFKELK